MPQRAAVTATWLYFQGDVMTSLRLTPGIPLSCMRRRGGLAAAALLLLLGLPAAAE